MKDWTLALIVQKSMRTLGFQKVISAGITYSTGKIINYDGPGSYGGAFAQGGVSAGGIGINHCYDPNAEVHKNAVQATTITFSKHKPFFGFGAGLDNYYTINIIN